MFVDMIQKNKEQIDSLSDKTKMDDPDRFSKIRWVEREEDPELKKNYEDS